MRKHRFDKRFINDIGYTLHIVQASEFCKQSVETTLRKNIRRQKKCTIDQLASNKVIAAAISPRAVNNATEFRSPSRKPISDKAVRADEKPAGFRIVPATVS